MQANACRLARQECPPGFFERSYHSLNVEVDPNGSTSQVLDRLAESFDAPAQSPELLALTESGQHPFGQRLTLVVCHGGLVVRGCRPHLGEGCLGLRPPAIALRTPSCCLAGSVAMRAAAETESLPAARASTRCGTPCFLTLSADQTLDRETFMSAAALSADSPFSCRSPRSSKLGGTGGSVLRLRAATFRCRASSSKSGLSQAATKARWLSVK
jgi:hypothetical protein